MLTTIVNGLVWRKTIYSIAPHHIYKYIHIFMIFDKDQVDSARRIESELNICLII